MARIYAFSLCSHVGTIDVCCVQMSSAATADNDDDNDVSSTSGADHDAQVRMLRVAFTFN